MGKKVFEVAKELGVDHRELLKKCDALDIDVRNYMSVLTAEQEDKLRGSMGGARKIVEKVQAPGVVRRRRAAKPARDAKPIGLKPRTVVPTLRKPTTPEPVVKPEAKPVVAEPVAAPEVAPKPEPTAPVDTQETAPKEPVAAPPTEAKEDVAPTPVEAATEKAAAPSDKEPARPAAAPAPGPAAGRGTIRKPTGAGGAKVLGSIPIEQLQARTARPQQRRGPNPRQGQHRGGNDRGPAPRTNWDPTQMAAGMPPPPPSADGTRRRRNPGAQRDVEKADGPRRTQTKRRQVFSREDIYSGSSARPNRGRKRKASSKKGAKTQITTPAAHKRVVRMNETITVGDLGKAMGVKSNDLISKLIAMGTMATINERLDIDTATLLATEYEYEVKNIAFDEEEVLSGPLAQEVLDDDPDALPRAPVVTIMGHVDHGKTTLLDNIRKASVAEGEAGGITQHIGAYKVPVGDKEVVFLDTPGHAAFTAMRARGASVTDIIVLVVAADDGVMPQTEESINHAKAAGVPLVVAINKCDKPDVDPERIKQELTQFELVPEEWGGETMFVPISALRGDGLDDLLEGLALQAEVLELKANPKKPGFGSVVEARMVKGRGNVCTVLVQEGTLKKGDFIVAGSHYGRIRAMLDNSGGQLKAAGPSTPIEVLGLGGLPAAGDTFHVVKNEKDAKRVIENRADKSRAAAVASRENVDPLDMLAAFNAPDKEKQNLILKTDVAGSYEALKIALEQLSTDEVEAKLLHGGVGPVTQSDVDLASVSEAAVLAFNIDVDPKAKRLADQAGVTIYKHSVIYDLIDGVKDLMSGLLAPEISEEYLGRAEVRAVFHIQKVGAVAGSAVTDGKMLRNCLIRVKRDGEELLSGKLHTLKRFKDDAKEVASGYECGIAVEGYKDIKEGDILEAFEVVETQRSIG
ncbi:MAG: translation initiation factor IF-2 [Bradymonadia bacterium]